MWVPGNKLGRNDKSCTFLGLGRRGVTFDLERDALAIARCATTNNHRSYAALIQNHPQNLQLIPPKITHHLGSSKKDSTISQPVIAQEEWGELLTVADETLGFSGDFQLQQFEEWQIDLEQEHQGRQRASYSRSQGHQMVID